LANLLDWRILCTFVVVLSHMIPRLRSSSTAASCRLPSPLANLLYWRIPCAFVASTHSMPHLSSSSAAARSSDTLRSFICFLDGFYNERGQLAVHRMSNSSI
jgi:hypothetical protein